MNGNVVKDILVTDVPGERWMTKDTSRKHPGYKRIAQLAYHLYEVRGRQDGHDVEDWLLAEDRLANTSVAWSRYIAASTDSEDSDEEST
jgi:hypothetical protein